MDQITEQYNQAAQKQFSYIEAISQAFRTQCEKLKNETEQQIATLDQTKPESTDQANHLKLKLKRDLKIVLDQYEKELRRSFGIGLTELESIYCQKGFQRMAEIEKEISLM